ncbi:MAG: esterase/lipase family protein [Luteolibacter sp.]
MRKHHLVKLLSVSMFAGTACSHSSPTPPPRTPRVVLVHGIFENGKRFKTFKNHLEARGFECYVPVLDHLDGRGGLENLAVGLKRDIDHKFGPEAPISIVGFSMGGIVSRQYLQHLGGAERCENFITISSPHHGTALGWIYPSQGVAQMRPNSPFLAELARSEDRLGKIRVTSLRTPLDLIILPPRSSVWDRAENLEYPVLMHPLMLESRKVLAEVEQRLLK